MKYKIVNSKYQKASCRRQAGFTLVELILYISIVTIMLSALIPFAWNIIQTSVKSSTQEEVSSAGRYLSERLKYEIRNANDLDTANSDFDVNLASNPSAKITLLDTTDTPLVFSVLNGTVGLTRGIWFPVTLNSSNTQVTNLTFTNYTSSDNKTKNIGFTITLTTGTSGQRSEYQATMQLRGNSEIRSN